MSLDGFITGPNASAEHPLGIGGERLHEWMFPPKGNYQKVVDEMCKNVGAVVMGRQMFNTGEEPWGDNPPFHMPVFVLTHKPRPKIVKERGTTFTFVTDGIESALNQANAAAGDNDVMVAGGANVAQQCLKAGLLDEIWSSLSGSPDIPENYKTVRYELSTEEDRTRLTITQDNNDSQEEANHSEQNWKMVLDGMKKLLEG